MSHEEWVTEAKVQAGLAVQVVVDQARRNGLDLGFWETRLIVGTSLADDAETAMGEGRPDPPHVTPRPEYQLACPKCGHTSGVKMQRPNETTAIYSCSICGNRWDGPCQ